MAYVTYVAKHGHVQFVIGYVKDRAPELAFCLDASLY